MTMTTRLGWLEDWRTLYWALVWTIIGFLVNLPLLPPPCSQY
jgi:hypothetical protein